MKSRRRIASPPRLRNNSRDLGSAEWDKETRLQRNNFLPLMSALGQKRTLEHVRAMSALPPKADILHCSEERRYSITSSARLLVVCAE
jgi:hypothetical protein